MAEKRIKSFKVDYKNLVREIKKTRLALERIEKKVAREGKKRIALEIKLLDDLLVAIPPRMTYCPPRITANITPRMTKCSR
jgi:hypothetical protein